MWFGYESQRLEKILHPISALPPHGLGDMSVTVQRECRGIVSGILLDCFYIIAGSERIHYVCVPEIMEAMPFQPCLFENFLEGFPDSRL